MLYKKYLTKEQAIQKLKHYCNYQERSHHEVREKLFSLGVRKNQHDEILAALIENGYLNEERFAVAFASGKFRLKQWGKIRIKAELRKRRVSDYCINKAIQQIGNEEYQQAMKKIGDKYFASIKNEEEIIRKQKTIKYLMSKGFESELARTFFQ